MPETYLETAIVITMPNEKLPGHYLQATQVLVRVPGHIDPKDIAVDFRPNPGAVWTPSDFFPDTVKVEHQ